MRFFSTGAWMDQLFGKSVALNQTIPVAYLVCNGSPPTDTTPSLMTFRDVETLFHEFGHGLQHMLTDVKHGGKYFKRRERAIAYMESTVAIVVVVFLT